MFYLDSLTVHSCIDSVYNFFNIRGNYSAKRDGWESDKFEHDISGLISADL